MELAAGRGFLIRHAAHGAGLVVIVAVVAAFVLVRFWPRIVSWFENRRR